MDSKIFLRKYRVAGGEIEAVGEPGDRPLVYEGEEIDSGRKMLLEVVPAAALKTAAREQLQAEAIAAKKLNHLNIHALHDFGIQDDDLVYVTEDFEGTPAEEWVNTHGPMPVGPVLRIASQVVSALGKAAFHRIVHRAINPGNLVLVPGQTAQGEWPLVKVLHFVGVVPRLAGTNGSAAALDKSLPYASPEQLQRGAVDFRSEIYSLGGTMWFLLTGTPPPMTAKEPMAAQSATTGMAAAKVSPIPSELRRLLAQMLSANPDARPRDPLAFHQRLQDCLAQVERPVRMSRTLGTPVSRTGATGMRRVQVAPLKAFASAAIFLALAALTALVLQRYVPHRRIVRAEESISVPVRVTKAFSSPTPVTPTATEAMVWVATPPITVADWNSTQPVPENYNADARPPAANVVEYASTKKIAVVPVLTISDPPASLRTRPKAPVTASNVSLPPSAINATPQVELAPAPAKPRDGEPRAVAPQSAPKKNLVREVRRAEPAEPAHPGKKPAAVAPNTTPPVSPQTNSAIQAEEAKREATGRSRKAKRPDSEPPIPLKVPR